MKYFILLNFLIPILTFGQVSMDDLIRKNGIAYEKNKTEPFTGTAISYFKNGDPETTLEYKNGISNGKIESWYRKDVKKIEGFVENGKQTGTWHLYYDNGKLQKQTTYEDGKESGEETFWFENGNIKKKGSYSSGKENGKYMWYFDNGNKQQEGYFINGKEDSVWTEWFENGTLKMVGHFTNFEKNGNWTWYDEKGNIETSKNYTNGLVTVDKDNLDTYLEKMEYYITKRNYKESLRNVELAEATITDKTESNPIYMGLIVYHSKCYYLFSHFTQGQQVLLSAIGLSDTQCQTILNSEIEIENSSDRINQVIREVKQKDKSKFQVSNHIALALCYSVLRDSVRLKQEQQVMMDKGNMQDWIIDLSLALYDLANARFSNYTNLKNIENTIEKEGVTEKSELDKAMYLLRTESFDEAEKIVDKYLQTNEKNVNALLLKSDIEMAYGNVDEMKIYEDKVLAIDPNAYSNMKN